MNNTMKYKGYTGSVEISEEDSVFFGKILGIRDLVNYQGKTAPELIEGFHSAVDSYLEFCSDKEITPEPGKDIRMVALSAAVCEKVMAAAEKRKILFRQFLEDAAYGLLAALRENS